MFSFSYILKNSLQNDLRFLTTVGTKPHKIVIPHLDDEIFNKMKDGTMTAKIHPGRIKTTLVEFDDSTINTIKNIFKDTNMKNLSNDSTAFCRYIKARHPPPTLDEIKFKEKEYINKILEKNDPSDLNTEKNVSRFKITLKKKLEFALKQSVYAWKPIEFTSYVGKQYLLNRMPAEYAVLNRIFLEISNRCPEFTPSSLLDFGSGVGTVTSVIRKYWGNSIIEYFNVDSSPEMHKIAKMMLTGGDPEGTLPIKHVFYRQFLPSRTNIKYDIVVCSYSLFEFSNTEIRLQTLLKLWNNTNDFFIIVEQGTTQGFKLIEEARNFIVQTDALSEYSSGVHIFSPCPHETDCPQVKFTEKPCCFRAHYFSLPISKRSTILTEYYSYVIFKKGKRPSNDPAWPRVIRPVYKRKKRATCHLCTKDCKLRTLVFTKNKHGLTNYHVARSVKVGDRLPMTFSECFLEDLDYDADTEVHDVSEEDFSDYDDETEHEFNEKN